MGSSVDMNHPTNEQSSQMTESRKSLAKRTGAIGAAAAIAVGVAAASVGSSNAAPKPSPVAAVDTFGSRPAVALDRSSAWVRDAIKSKMVEEETALVGPLRKLGPDTAPVLIARFKNGHVCRLEHKIVVGCSLTAITEPKVSFGPASGDGDTVDPESTALQVVLPDGVSGFAAQVSTGKSIPLTADGGVIRAEFPGILKSFSWTDSKGDQRSKPADGRIALSPIERDQLGK